MHQNHKTNQTSFNSGRFNTTPNPYLQTYCDHLNKNECDLQWVRETGYLICDESWAQIDPNFVIQTGQKDWGRLIPDKLVELTLNLEPTTAKDTTEQMLNTIGLTKWAQAEPAMYDILKRFFHIIAKKQQAKTVLPFCNLKTGIIAQHNTNIPKRYEETNLKIMTKGRYSQVCAGDSPSRSKLCEDLMQLWLEQNCMYHPGTKKSTPQSVKGIPNENQIKTPFPKANPLLHKNFMPEVWLSISEFKDDFSTKSLKKPGFHDKKPVNLLTDRSPESTESCLFWFRKRLNAYIHPALEIETIDWAVQKQLLGKTVLYKLLNSPSVPQTQQLKNEKAQQGSDNFEKLLFHKGKMNVNKLDQTNTYNNIPKYQTIDHQKLKEYNEKEATFFTIHAQYDQFQNQKNWFDSHTKGKNFELIVTTSGVRGITPYMMFEKMDPLTTFKRKKNDRDVSFTDALAQRWKTKLSLPGKVQGNFEMLTQGAVKPKRDEGIRVPYCPLSTGDELEFKVARIHSQWLYRVMCAQPASFSPFLKDMNHDYPVVSDIEDYLYQWNPHKTKPIVPDVPKETDISTYRNAIEKLFNDQDLSSSYYDNSETKVSKESFKKKVSKMALMEPKHISRTQESLSKALEERTKQLTQLFSKYQNDAAFLKKVGFQKSSVDKIEQKSNSSPKVKDKHAIEGFLNLKSFDEKSKTETQKTLSDRTTSQDNQGTNQDRKSSSQAQEVEQTTDKISSVASETESQKAHVGVK